MTQKGVVMKEHATIEERILNRFLAKIEVDQTVPQEVVRRLRELCRRGEICQVSQVLDALREGVQEHAKNSAA